LGAAHGAVGLDVMISAVVRMAFAGALLPATTLSAFARACENTRPNWSAADGPMTMLGETLHIVTGSGVIGLFVLMALAARFKNRWFTWVVCACAFGAAFLYYNAWTAADPKSPFRVSIEEGCVGAPYGGIAILVVTALALIAWQYFGPERKKQP